MVQTFYIPYGKFEIIRFQMLVGGEFFGCFPYHADQTFGEL